MPPTLDEVASLEVRWILPGPLTTSMIQWFGRSPEEIELREDIYLVGLGVEGVSLKIRGGARLDLKVARGDGGVLDVPQRARGTIREWQKWSFPLPSDLETKIRSQEWVPVRKIRRIRRFSIVDGILAEGAHAANDGSPCAVELTDVSIGSERWWTLGMETIGRSDASRAAIDAAATLLFRDRLPDRPELAEADSVSYMDRLGSRRLSERS